MDERADMELLQSQLTKYAKDVAALYRDLRTENELLVKANRELGEGFYDMVLMALDMITLHDDSLGGHCKRVAFYSDGLATAVGIDGERIMNLKLAALLHDIGLLRLPRDARLRILEGTEESAEIIEIYQQHPIVDIRPIISSERFAGIAEIISAHHEHLDGSGFPAGLKEPRIPLESRVIAITDAYDLIKHCKTRGTEPRLAIATMEMDAGTKYDVQFLNSFKKIVLEGDPFTSFVEIEMEDLAPGYILSEAIMTLSDVKMLSADTVLREDHLEALAKYAKRWPLKLPIKIYLPQL
ncbi:MAG: hypothetical protein A2Y63_05775 [Candidatus Riflebacteria bacterium RBG_13_59_9]|nr:MAG: hypothetical protein A2Y63_05775 [Candidatus Riflebacteria bacterium RBG_13_59_9]